jgi:hypothetical protein
MFLTHKHDAGDGQPGRVPGEADTAAITVDRPWEVSGGLRRVGFASWLFVGIVAAAGVVLAGLVIAAGIMVPLLFAVYFGAVLFPFVDWLEQRGLLHSGGDSLMPCGPSY